VDHWDQGFTNRLSGELAENWVVTKHQFAVRRLHWPPPRRESAEAAGEFLQIPSSVEQILGADLAFCIEAEEQGGGPRSVSSLSAVHGN